MKSIKSNSLTGRSEDPLLLFVISSDQVSPEFVGGTGGLNRGRNLHSALSIRFPFH